MPLYISGTNGFSSNNTKWAFKPTDGGVIHSETIPFCYVQKTDGGGWGGTSGATSTIIFNYVIQNVGSYYNSSTGLFTCPVTARYRVDSWHLGGGNNGWSSLHIAKNGGSQSSHFHINSNGNNMYSNVNGFWIGICNAGDTLSSLLVTSGTNNVYLAAHTGMMVTLLD